MIFTIIMRILHIRILLIFVFQPSAQVRLIGDMLSRDVSLKNVNVMVFLMSSSSVNHPLDVSKSWVIFTLSQSTYFLSFTQNKVYTDISVYLSSSFTSGL